jgi:hypothetical protein
MNGDPYAYWIQGNTSDCNSMKHSTAFGEVMSTALRQELAEPDNDKSSIVPHVDLTGKRINTAFCYKIWGLHESVYSSNATPATPFIYKTYGNATHHATWINELQLHMIWRSYGALRVSPTASEGDERNLRGR